MASPTPRKSNVKLQTPASQLEVVSPVWLLKAAGVVVAAALICGYLTLCLFVYQGQWQLVLHPDKSTQKAVPTAALPFEKIPFGATESGQPRLAGWWLPADGPRAGDIVLFLHDGSGNLGANAEPLEALHAAGLSVFAFDYSGFGASDPTHPTQAKMTADADAALDYLANTRHLPAKTIVPYGAGLGASLALELAASHQELPAVIVESPNPDVLALAHADPRTSLVPLSWLFKERFELNLAIKTPKLLLTTGPSPVATMPSQPTLDQLYRSAATPSFIARPSSRAAFADALKRFLDEYMPTAPPQLPSAKP